MILPARAVGACLAISAALLSLDQLRLAMAPGDVGRFETTMALSISGQITRGPGHLYGPFGDSNPIALIHAPLYYRIAALPARALVGLGLTPLDAAFAAGRLISILACISACYLSYRIARIDAPRRAGLWAAFLIAASPIPGILSVMVRPDMFAVAAEMLGVYLVLRVLSTRGVFRERIDLVGGYLAFAVALCAKQHLVVAPAMSTALLLAGWRGGRVRFRTILIAHVVAATAVLVYLGIEDWATGGRMSECAFVLPGGPFRSLNRATWGHVAGVFAEIVKKLPGPIVLIIASAFIRRCRSTRLDLLLGLYLLAELISLVPLCLYNKGSADNYALTAAFFACILIGRALDRAADGHPLRPAIACAITLGLALLLARDVQFIYRSLRSGREDEAHLRSLLGTLDISDDLYFVDRPDLNRRFGRVELIHDEWLYAAFEQVGKAEPRTAWLRPALDVGPVRRIILPDDATTVPGLPESLEELGYKRAARIGPYRVWKRL